MSATSFQRKRRLKALENKPKPKIEEKQIVTESKEPVKTEKKKKFWNK